MNLNHLQKKNLRNYSQLVIILKIQATDSHTCRSSLNKLIVFDIKNYTFDPKMNYNKSIDSNQYLINL